MPYSEKYDVRKDGRVVLYQRTNLKRPKWQARISVPNATGYKVVSTKTTDFEEAKHFALNLYEELYYEVKAGGSLNSKTFKQVYEEWKHNPGISGFSSESRSWLSTVERVEAYALEFFGPKKINEITEADFATYWSWRKANFDRKLPRTAH